jgi:hypothetical protein
MSRARIIRILHEDRQKDGERLCPLVNPFLAGPRSPGQPEPVKQACIDVIGILSANLLHPIQVFVPSVCA